MGLCGEREGSVGNGSRVLGCSAAISLGPVFGAACGGCVMAPGC